MNLACAVVLLMAFNAGWAEKYKVAYTGPAGGSTNGSTSGYRYGDIVLAGLFPIHQNAKGTCGEILDLGIQRQEAMVFAIKSINDRKSLLPNHTLGFDIRDTCVNQEIALQHSLDFLNVDVGGSRQKKRITGVVGAASSQVSIYVANLLRLFEIPQVSYASTAKVLSDKSRYDYFFRTVPPDSLQARAMAHLVEHHNWTYVSLINTDDAYGRDGIEAFQFELENLINRTNKTFCVAAKVQLSLVASPEDYDNAIKQLFAEEYTSNATVVVIFGQLVTAEGVLEAFQRIRNLETIPGLEEKCITWIASDAWGDQINPKHYPVAHGMLSIIPKKVPYPEFDEYFLSLNPKNNHQNPWFIEYWEKVFNCSMKNNSNLPVCDVENQKLGENYKQNSKVPFTIDAIYVLAHALGKIVEHITATNSSEVIIEGDDLRKELKITKFTSIHTDAKQLGFDNNGDILGEGYGIYNLQKQSGHNNYTFIKVGNWDAISDSEKGPELQLIHNVTIEWNHNYSRPKSICSEPCKKGEHPTYIDEQSRCCWKCEDCANREVSNGTECVKCDIGYIPNKERSRCMEISPTYLSWNTGWAIFACILCVLGIILTVGIAILFLIKWNDSSVKSSSRELSFSLLGGLLLCYITPFFYISRPTHITCGIQQFLLGFSFCICYAAILVKTNRLYRIFHLHLTNKKVPMISSTSQLLFTAALVLVQCVINGIWLVVVPPAPQYLYTENSVELTCAEASSYRSSIVSLGYNGLLLVIGTIYAVRARNIPADYNEVKYINGLMIITCIIWLIYIPTNFATAQQATNYQIGSHILAIVVSATTILGALFFPKVYFIFRQEVKSATVKPPSVQPRGNSIGSVMTYGKY